MENLTNQLLSLGSGKKYFVLRQAVYKGTTYYFAAEVTDDEENFTNKFIFLEAKTENEELFVKEVKDEKIVGILAKNVKFD